MTQVANIVDRLDYPTPQTYIGRAGRGFDGYFGNPFRLTKEADRQAILRVYRNWFYDKIGKDPVFCARIEALRGHTLLCFCKPLACHGDVIKEYLDATD